MYVRLGISTQLHTLPVRRAVLAQQIAIGAIVGVREERLLPPVAALGHVVRNAGNDKSREPGHAVHECRCDSELLI